MITPIILPSFKLPYKTAVLNSKNNIVHNNNTPQYFTNSISFAQSYYQMPTQPASRFTRTIKRNFFQLPKIKLKNGQEYQLQPDKNQIQGAQELYNGNNLLYCVSTGSGKTAVAHWAMTKNLSENKKSIYTVPVKALANDKYDEFCEIYGEDQVGILTGDTKRNPDAPIVIMTTEIYDKQIESEYFNANSIGTVIYDEAHYIDDNERGSAWENSIIKSSEKNIQMLLLSATVGNSEEFRGWIASLNPQRKTKKVEVDPQDRFVPQLYYHYLNESFIPLIDGTIDLSKKLSERQNRGLEIIYKTKNNKDIDYTVTAKDLEQTLEELKDNIKKQHFSPKKLELDDIRTTLQLSYKYLNDDQIEAVCNFLLPPNNKVIGRFHSPDNTKYYAELIFHMKEENMLPAIVYRLSKGKCELTAKEIAFAEPSLDLTTDEEKKQIGEIIDKYKKDKKYLGRFGKNERAKLINGVGTHHSSRAPEYKALVEELFRKKLLKVVVATSTLGVGIDMPAKSTVISDITYKEIDPNTQKKKYTPVSENEFFQMIGRAGRRGQDAVGNVIIYKPYSIPKDKKKQSNTRINEEKLIQEYLISKPNAVYSSFKPSVTGLAQYFMHNNKTDGLKDVIDKSFKIYLSENKKEEAQNLLTQFLQCTYMLLKTGYIYGIDDKIHTTPKGKILALSKCSNPLMLASVLYDEALKSTTVEQLCQIAGYIAGSEIAPKTDQTPDFEKMLKARVEGLENGIEDERETPVFDANFGYESAKSMFQKLEKTQSLSNMITDKYTDIEGISYSSPLSGYITYCWAILNKYRPDSISNFEKIITYTTSEDSEEQKEIFASSTAEGDCYKLIAQTVSVLKQMSYICDYAMKNEYNFPNTEYWQSVKEKTQQAIDLMNKPPIHEFDEPESKAISEVENIPVSTCPICEKPMAPDFQAQKYSGKMLYLSGQEAYNHIENGIENGLLSPMSRDEKNGYKFAFNRTAQEALKKIQESTLEYPNLNVRAIIEKLAETYSDDIKLERMLVIEEIQDFVKANVKNDKLKEKLSEILEDAQNKITEESIDKFKISRLDRKIKNAINKAIIGHKCLEELQKEDEKLYATIKSMEEKMPSSENNLKAFFIALNEQSDEKIASAFANKRYSTTTQISPYGSDDYNEPENFIKICSECKEERGTTKFSEWIKHIPNYRKKLQTYLDSIPKDEKYANYAAKLNSKLKSLLET